MKQSSSMITGSACSGSSTPPMPTPPERWHVLADLRAGADRGPGVDHGALVDIGADIHEARHQHDARRDVGRAAHDGAGHGAEAGFLEAVLAPAGELQRHLVVPGAGGACPSARNRSGGSDSSTAFFSHWLTFQPPAPSGSATRAWPESSASSAASTAARSDPPVAEVTRSRTSHRGFDAGLQGGLVHGGSPAVQGRPRSLRPRRGPVNAQGVVRRRRAPAPGHGHIGPGMGGRVRARGPAPHASDRALTGDSPVRRFHRGDEHGAAP